MTNVAESPVADLDNPPTESPDLTRRNGYMKLPLRRQIANPEQPFDLNHPTNAGLKKNVVRAFIHKNFFTCSDEVRRNFNHHDDHDPGNSASRCCAAC